MNEYKGIVLTKIELTLEQSQQGVSNDVLVNIEGVEELKRNSDALLVFTVTNGNPSRVNLKQLYGSLILVESDSLTHAYAQTTKTYYNHQDSRIKKAQEFKTKTSANSDIQDLPLRYQVYQGRLLASFQDDAKYEHVGQDTRSQGRKDDHYRRIKI
ncbi:hypothetical protein Tco_0489031 [Tanacetum coccineum]